MKIHQFEVIFIIIYGKMFFFSIRNDHNLEEFTFGNGIMRENSFQLFAIDDISIESLYVLRNDVTRNRRLLLHHFEESVLSVLLI